MTQSSSTLDLFDSSASNKPESAAVPSRRSIPRVIGIAGGILVGVVILVLLLALLLVIDLQLRQTPAPGQATPLAESKPGSPGSLVRSFVADPSDKIPLRSPQRAQWNRELKSEIDRLFPGGVESHVGRSMYSEADAAMERLFDGDWYIGSGLTASGHATQFQVRQGKFFTAPLESELVYGEVHEPDAIYRSADSRFHLRTRTLMVISSAVLALLTDADGSQRVQGEVNTEVLQALPLDSVSLVIESVHSSGDAVGAEQISSPLDWAMTQSGSHEIDFPSGQLDSTLNYRLYIMGWSWSPKPGFFKLTQEYQGRFIDQQTKAE